MPKFLPTRRYVLAAGLALSGCSGVRSVITSSPNFADLEARVGGRLGVAVVGANRALLAGHRVDERFGMCSSFKMSLAGIVLREADQGRANLAELIRYSESDLLFNSPVTRARLAEGAMSLRDLAEAAQITSDNAAANLLIAQLGGPAAFTARLREIGDDITRLDRIEPEMNYVRASAGDERDTTTPGAMAQTALTLITGDALSQTSRALLLDWMRRTETGARRLRAGLPPAWNAGDKTGTGVFADLENKYNDVAVAFPGVRGALAIAAYYEAPGVFPNIRAEDEAVLAEVGRLTTQWLSA